MPGPETQPRPRRPFTRLVSRAAIALCKSIVAGPAHHGAIELWNPALGDVVDGPDTPAPTSSHHGEQMAASSHTRRQLRWSTFVKYFTPSWFTVTMGTGIVASLLNQFPYHARWLYWLSVVVFCLNIALFGFFVVVFILQYVLFPQSWKSLFERPNQTFYLGAIPIGLSTIINMMVFVCVPAWGEWVIYTSWGLWMADAVLSLLSSILLPFLLIKRTEDTPLSSITALQLFPVIAAIVASATSALVSGVLPNHQQALVTVIIGYILWGLGVPSAIFILIMYFQRLTIYKIPPREVIVSCFIPLGPLNMGSFAIMKLGRVAMEVFPLTKTIHPLAGDLAYNLGVFVALILWGFTLLWLFLAVATIFHSKHFPFNMGWWGFTFPIGTFALSSNTLAIEIPSRFFRVIGSILSVCVFLLWLLVGGATIRDVITGGKKLISAPSVPGNVGVKDNGRVV